MDDSRHIPARVRRAVLMESGHCCAVPTCPLPADELHHIKPFAEGGEHTVENLIALCRNHHGWVHDGIIDTKSVKAYKEQLKQYQPKLAEVQTELAELRGKVEAIHGLVTENEQLKARIAVLEERTAQAVQGEAKDSLGQRSRKLQEADELFENGLAFGDREQYPKALECFEACRSIEETWEVLINLGVVYCILGQYREALTAYDRAEELRQMHGLPDDAILALNRGSLFRALGMEQKALAAYKKGQLIQQNDGVAEHPGFSMGCGTVYISFKLHEKL